MDATERKGNSVSGRKKEVQMLKELYPEMSNAAIAKRLKRPKASVDKKGFDYNLKKSKEYRREVAKKNNSYRRNSGKKEEIAQLKKLYKTHTYREHGRYPQAQCPKASRARPPRWVSGNTTKNNNHSPCVPGPPRRRGFFCAKKKGCSRTLREQPCTVVLPEPGYSPAIFLIMANRLRASASAASYSSSACSGLAPYAWCSARSARM
jgi:hypothetical protein